MNKTKKALLIPLAVLALAGCGEKQPDPSVSLSVSEFTMGTDTAKKLVASAKNGSGEVTWASSDETVVTVNEQGRVEAVGIGSAKITASYSEKTATCDVTVVNFSDKFTFGSVTKNQNIKDFETNVLDAEDDFRGETVDEIEVGDDNEFVMKPTMKIWDKTSFEETDLESLRAEYTTSIKVLDNGNYVQPTKTYAEFNQETCAFNFNEDAIGEQFELSVVPTVVASDSTKKTTVKVKVSDGYNVYTANDLAYMNDVTFESDYRQGSGYDDQYNAGWINFRTAHGLDANYLAPSIFLQSNIQIKRENLPDIMFWTAAEEGGQVGKMKDGTDVYVRYANDFSFNGNYFNVDTQELPVGGNDANGNNISHSTLFKVVEKKDLTEEVEGRDLLFKNCSYFGNAPFGTDESVRFGLIFFKVQNDTENEYSVNATFDNFNVLRAAISFYSEYGFTNTTIKDCVASQGYANGIYVFRNGDLEIKNSKLETFGGPIIVTDGTSSEHASDPGFHISVDSSSVLNNWVTGEEPWFVNTGANMAIPLFKNFNTLPTNENFPVKQTFIKNEQFGQETLEKMNVILINYNKNPYCELSINEGTIGCDRDTDHKNEDAYYNNLKNGKMYCFSEKGASVEFVENQPTGESIQASAMALMTSKYFGMSMFNENFGYVLFVTELIPFAA